MNDRIYRSRDDRILAGVAGGLAEHWDADPSLVRLIWALLMIFTGGIALLVYIVMAIVVPEEPSSFDAFPATGPPPPVAGVAAPSPTTDWRVQQAASRAAARDARRAARRARRANNGRTGTLIVGSILVLAGVWFLLREYLPAFDTDWLWPMALVILGVVILVLAIRPRSEEGTGPSTGGDDTAGTSASGS
jgi:phage shock protein C